MPDRRRAVAQVVSQPPARRHRSQRHCAAGVARLGNRRGRDGSGARGCACRPRPCRRRDAAGGARRRRNSEVSSRRLMNWLTTLLRRPDIAWTDALDIAIVAILVYELLLLIRGTRAAQMALSAGFILLLYFLSEWLQLETVNWVIRNLAAYVVFAIIVLFQADIRRALAHFGRAPFFRYFARAEHADETIEELVTAATNLAARRIGAIIVLERQIGLRNYIEGGIPLDAMITYDLLSSIFQPGSPLHDGAVIIQGDRIAAAACFLPLSVNPRVSRDLGTRHRAALGLTEENDAIAIVVSEETGAISVATGGTLDRNVSADALRTRLATLLGYRRRRIRRVEEARSSLA